MIQKKIDSELGKKRCKLKQQSAITVFLMNVLPFKIISQQKKDEYRERIRAPPERMIRSFIVMHMLNVEEDFCYNALSLR